MSKWPQTHPWDVTPKEAIAIQQSLRDKVIIDDNYASPKSVAGVDVGFEQEGKITRAAVVVLSFPELELIEHRIARLPTRFPYVPGLLSFREVPAVLEALSTLQRLPDMILCDGQGYAHPRRMGIACHLGVITDIPTIGVGKTRLCGSYTEPGIEKGDWSPLMDKQEVIGAVLRTRKNIKPLFISSGHRVSLESAVSIVMACLTKYKLPETTRWAHYYASIKREDDRI